MPLLDDSAVYNAAHAVYCLEYAGVSEERGASFSQCNLVDVIDRLPNEKLAPIVWRMIGKIENAIGYDIGLMFYHAGIEGEDEQTHALTNLLLGCYGHGSSIADDHEHAWRKACEVLKVEYDSAPIYVEPSDWRELAETELDAAVDNLDCIDVEQLEAIAANENKPKLTRDYAACKAQAMQQRLAGNIQAAQQLETRCESIYDRLPESLRW